MRLKGFDNELSEAVRQHPCLYDRSSPYFNNRDYVAKCWEMVATTSHIPDAETARRAFENLRKRYNKVRGQYHIKHPLDVKERSVVARELTGYTFIAWLDPFIHRRRSRNNDSEEHFNATMVSRDQPPNGVYLESEEHQHTPSMYSDRMSNDGDSTGVIDERSGDGTFATYDDRDNFHSTLEGEEEEESKPDLIASRDLFTRGNESTLSSTMMTTESHENEVSTTCFSSNSPIVIPRPDSSSSMRLTSATKQMMKRKLDAANEMTSVSSSPNYNNLPKVNSYTSVHRSSYSSKLKKNNNEKDLSVVRRRAATDLQSLSSESTSMNGFHSVNHKMDETSLFLQLLKTKLDKLSAKSKLNCQNELLQCVLKYELKLVDLATTPDEG